MSTKTDVEIDGRSITLTNIDKILYPNTGTTKGDVIKYYVAIAPTLLPYIQDRPFTLKQYPEGVRGFHFYVKECPTPRPNWMKTATVARTQRPGAVHYCLINDTAALAWVANRASLEMHVLLSKAPEILHPTWMAFDLDPGEGRSMVDAARAAIWVRDALTSVGLQSFAKTSGKKGVHLFVPLNTPATFDETKGFAHALAMRLERDRPKDIVSKMSKALRRDRIFIDWSQNDDHKTTAAPYSLRATERPSVSMPLSWDELEEAVRANDPERLFFSPDDALKRVREKGDLFAPILTLKQRLPSDVETEAAAGPSRAARARASRSRRTKSPAALQRYQSMRHFDVTPEPSGQAPRGESTGPRFVIQKHDASRLHYDFRLEEAGVLKSWAVPKGPSTQPHEHRLAMETEDHPLGYASFEGVIPEGEYGAGPVLIWDRGTFVNLSNHDGKLISFAAGLRRGHVDFWLKGEKLKGGWSLIRTGDEPRRWLLTKMRDAAAGHPARPVDDRPESVVSGRTIEQIRDDAGSAVWHSNRSGGGAAVSSPRARTRERSGRRAAAPPTRSGARRPGAATTASRHGA